MKVIKCKCFMISKLTNKHKYFAFFLLGSLFRVLFPYILYKINQTKIEEFEKYIGNRLNRLNYLLTQKYIEIIRNIISALFLGFFHCLYRVKNIDESKKRQMQTYNTNSQNINDIFKAESSRVPITSKYIFLISFVDIICQMLIPLKFILEYKFSFKNILSTEPSRLYILLFFDIFARYIFSRWLLKTYFYAHHKFSFFLNFLGLILIGIEDLTNKFQFVYKDYVNPHEDNFDLLYIGILSIQLILYSFEDIMNKIAFRRLAILPSTLLFYNGIFLFAYFIIISLFYFICGVHNFLDGKKGDYLLYELQYSIVYIPFNILRNYNILNVIDKFSAAHMTFLRVSETVIIFFYNIIIDSFSKNNIDDIWKKALQSIGFILLFVSTLIHNEIIIINHPKLKAKTEYYLDKDADREQISSFYSDTFFTDSKDGSESHSNLYDDLTGSDIS